ncbi:MAG: nitroreductase family protein [Kiritimatiellae bacterium]|nr:nitroreductase family protein [Kiritimatiellia bacterium]
MDLQTLIRSRRSVRLFSSTPVKRDDLLAILEAGRLAPSACNNQPLRFVVVTEKRELDLLATAYPREWLRTAPAMIVICGNHDRAWHRTDGKDHADIDAAIATDHMTLAAAERDLGTCWICAFDAAKLREVLALPTAWEPIAMLPVGHPAEAAAPASQHHLRKSLADLTQWGLTP